MIIIVVATEVVLQCGMFVWF